MCYFSERPLHYGNMNFIGTFQYRKHMQSSTLCIVARGDNPRCPKLAESIVHGCIPVIVLDQRLPFENKLNYSLFSLRFEPREILKDPYSIRRTLSSVRQSRILEMRRELTMISDMFSIRPGGTPFNLQNQLVREMC